MTTPKNMVSTLSKRSYKQNMRRNMVAILAIIMTTLLFTTLAALTQSISKNMKEMAFKQSGYTAHANFNRLTEDEIRSISKHSKVKAYGRSIVVGVAANKDFVGRNVEIRYADDNYANDMLAFPLTGSMPKSRNEIAVDTQTLNKLGLPHELGQKLTLYWHEDITDLQTEPIASEFILCGFWEGNEFSRTSYAWVSETFALEACNNEGSNQEGQVLGLRTMTITLFSGDKIKETMENIVSDTGLSSLKFGTNYAFDPSTRMTAQSENLVSYVGMLLVFIAGYLIIYNIFQISVTTDIQFYGKLKTLGTTKKQLRRFIYSQANRLCLIGIPIGLAMGYLIGVLLVPLFFASLTAKASISVNPLIFIGSAAFAWLTVFISCLRPAKIAASVSPMEALRYNDASISSAKKNKKGKNGATLLNMAWSNLGRNKKRTATVLCSLTLGLVILSSFYAQNAAYDLDKYLSSYVIADFQIDDATDINNGGKGFDPFNNTIDNDLLSKIDEVGTSKTGRIFYQDIKLELSDKAIQNTRDFFENGRLEEMKSYYPGFERYLSEYNDALSSKLANAAILGADGLALDAAVDRENILSGTFDAESFASGQYILAICPKVKNVTSPSFSIGEKVTVMGREFTLMAAVAPVTPITSGNNPNLFEYRFIIPATAFLEMFPNNSMRKFYCNVVEEKREQMQMLLTAYQKEKQNDMVITTKQSKVKQFNDEVRSNAIMGNCISITIALVGILNFINSMVTSIVSRKKEFATIQSIGMTTVQLKKMLIGEGLLYAGLTFIASCLLSIGSLEFVIRPMVYSGFTSYRFTLLPLILCTPVILLFAVLVPHLCFKNIEKHSLVERLRNSD